MLRGYGEFRSRSIVCQAFEPRFGAEQGQRLLKRRAQLLLEAVGRVDDEEARRVQTILCLHRKRDIEAKRLGGACRQHFAAEAVGLGLRLDGKPDDVDSRREAPVGGSEGARGRLEFRLRLVGRVDQDDATPFGGGRSAARRA